MTHDNGRKTSPEASSTPDTGPLHDQSPRLEKNAVLLRFLSSPELSGRAEPGGGNSTTPRGIPSWERDPTPLEGWSVDEQSVLLEMMRKCPQLVRRNPDQRRIVYGRCAARMHALAVVHIADHAAILRLLLYMEALFLV